MNIVFSKHSLLKLGHRGVSREKVVRTLEIPDYILPSYADRMRAYKKFGKLYLKIVFKREKGDILVVTQYWEEKFQPPKNI